MFPVKPQRCHFLGKNTIHKARHNNIPEFSTQTQIARKQLLLQPDKHSELAKKFTIFLDSIYTELNATRSSDLPNLLSTAGAFNAKKFVSEEHKKFRIFATNPLGSK